MYRRYYTEKNQISSRFNIFQKTVTEQSPGFRTDRLPRTDRLFQKSYTLRGEVST